jgi:hypothetical protein
MAELSRRAAREEGREEEGIRGRGDGALLVRRCVRGHDDAPRVGRARGSEVGKWRNSPPKKKRVSAGAALFGGGDDQCVDAWSGFAVLSRAQTHTHLCVSASMRLCSRCSVRIGKFFLSASTSAMRWRPAGLVYQSTGLEGPEAVHNKKKS